MNPHPPGWPELVILIGGLILLLFAQTWWLAFRFLPLSIYGFFAEDLKQGWREARLGCDVDRWHPVYVFCAVRRALRVCTTEWLNCWAYEGTYGSEPNLGDGVKLLLMGVVSLGAWRAFAWATGRDADAWVPRVLVPSAIWLLAACMYFYRRVPHSYDE